MSRGNQKNFRSIAAIAGFCFIIIGAVWVLVINQLREDKDQIIEAAIQRNSNLAVALEQYSIRTIDNTDALMMMVKREYELNEDKTGFENLLKHHLSRDGLISLISIADSAGNIVATTEESKEEKIVNVSDREYFRHQASTSRPGLYIGTPVKSRITGRAVIPLARRITTSNKGFGGVVVVGIDPKNFTQFYADANLRSNDIISLINPEGITYARRTGNKDSWGENISKSPLFTHLKTKPVSNYFAPDAIRNIPTYFSYRKFESYPIIATVGSAEDEILAEFSAWKRRNYIAVSFISILLLLFAALVAYLLIAKRKTLEKLEESEEKYRSFFEKTSDAILIVNREGKLTAANKAATLMFEDSLSTLCNSSFSSLIDLSDPAVKKILANPLTEFKGELRFKKKSGAIFYTETVASPYHAGELEASIMIIRDITGRKEMEKKLLEDQKNYQQRVTREVIQAQEREREEIGRELHDNVNQVLTTVKLYLDLSLVEPEQSPSLIRKSISYVLQSINEIRNLSRDLSAPTLGTRSVIDAITALVEMVQTSSGIRIVFRHHYMGEMLSKDQTLALYRILQEQLNNVIRHSEASRVLINLTRKKDQLYFEIRDNGKGFDLSRRRSGIGLNNIVSRTKIFDGEVKILSEPGKGCTLRITMPLQLSESRIEQSLSL